MSTGKKVSVPNYFFFYRADALLPEGSLRKALLEPVISLFDSESLSPSVLNEAIRSVTHLVLAPDQESSFFFSSSKSFPVFVLVFLAIDRSAHPAAAGPENVQYRSVFIQCIRALVRRPCRQAPASNTALTRGTVESPAKLFSKQFHLGC